MRVMHVDAQTVGKLFQVPPYFKANVQTGLWPSVLWGPRIPRILSPFIFLHVRCY